MSDSGEDDGEKGHHRLEPMIELACTNMLDDALATALVPP